MASASISPSTGPVGQSITATVTGFNFASVTTSNVFCTINSNSCTVTSVNRTNNTITFTANYFDNETPNLPYGVGIFFASPFTSISAGSFTYTNTCFHEDTKILTSKGYLPIKNLKKGDLVQTLNHGFKPIHLIGYSQVYNSRDQQRILHRLYRYPKESLNELFDDLIVTGAHSILVDQYKNENQKEENEKVFGDSKNYVIDDKFCLHAYIDERSVPYEKEGVFTIYHLALENEDEFGNYGIYANGLLVEAIDINCMINYSGMTFIE